MFKGQLGVESVVAMLGSLSAAALATAFLYDSVFFLVLSPTLLHLLSLSDHVETAVEIVPWIICLTLTTMSCLAVAPNMARHLPALIIFGIAATVFLGANVYYFGADIWATYGWTGAIVFVIGVALIVTLATYLRTHPEGRQEPAQDDPPQAFLPSMLIALVAVYWIAGTVLCGASNAKAVNSPEEERKGLTRYTLVLQDNSAIATARIARMVEKGAILVTPSRSLVQFVPKEDIRRIDIFQGGAVLP